jgi:general secretion pathway protein C
LASATVWIDDLKSVQGLTRLLVDRGAQLIVLLLLLALGLDSALILTRALGHGPDLPAPAVGSAPVLPRVSLNPSLQLATIVNAHLFGGGAVAGGGTDAPATSMPLILAGVIADPDPGKGVAIIGENAAAGKLYAVGAAMPGGVHLHAVYADRVLLERNGGLETLMLPRTPLNGKGAATPNIASAAPRAGAAGAAGRDSATLLAGLVRIQPVFNQGKLQGYRIFPGANHGATAFTQLGLKSGDLIEAVNGTPLDDAARAMEVLQTLSSSATATVTVSRNGAPQEVNLNLANLNLDADSGDNAAASPAAAPAAGAAANQAAGQASGQAVAPAPDQGSPAPAWAPLRSRSNLSTAPGAPAGSAGTINTAPPGNDAQATPAAGDRDR